MTNSEAIFEMLRKAAAKNVRPGAANPRGSGPLTDDKTLAADRDQEIPIEDVLNVAGFKSLSKDSPRSSIESALRDSIAASRATGA